MDTTQEALKLFVLWLMTLVRIVGFFVQAPIWGSHHFDKKVLVAMAASMAIIAFPNLPVPKNIPFDVFPFFLMLFTQFVVGLIIGFASFMIMSVAQFGGELLDTQMGLSVAASFDPASGGSTNMMRRLSFYLAMILYLCFDGHHYLIRAMFRSFELIPITGVNISSGLIIHLMHLTGQIFLLGIQISAPSLAALFLTQIALGLLARVAPQMNVFMLSFPLNIAVGLTLLSSSLWILTLTYQDLFLRNNNDVMQAIQMMVPVVQK
jgi:flagellar biosynthesis protein FliR